MSDEIYYKVAKVLDTLPNGFTSTPSGVEIKILKKIFKPEQAELFCDLRMKFENASEVSLRTGRELEGLEEKLLEMAKDGQVFSVRFGEVAYFKMVPWVFGIYEFQLERLDRELAEMVEEFSEYNSKQFFSGKPQLMQIIPVEEEIKGVNEPISYERVSAIIEHGQSFKVMECICKKEKALLDNPCSKPVEVCLGIAPIPDIFKSDTSGRVITRQEAYEILNMAEDSGLVHMTGNIQHGHIYICNCCSCCCGVLRSINEGGIPAALVVNSHYYAKIDADNCISCGICADERCQVNAIKEDGDTFKVESHRCIGCGLCISTCAVKAISLVRKPDEQIEQPPLTEKDWFEERGKSRGVDFSAFK